MERLTKRTAEGIAYLTNVKQDEQVIEGSRNTLQYLYDSWQKLAEYEDRDEKWCEYCDERNMPLWWNNAGHPTKSFIEPNFCPMCGRQLTEGLEVANEND